METWVIMQSSKPPESSKKPVRRLPPWLKRPLPAGETFSATAKTVSESGVATVCQSARCPNRAECWSHKTATFMILGDQCTRHCRFCAVSSGSPAAPDADEPVRLAKAVASLELRHVVITSVTRDDLPDEGAGHFAECVTKVRESVPEATIEVLPADFHAREECIRVLCEAGPDVYNHNLETVKRLTASIRPQADYDRSLDVLRTVRRIAPTITTKSGIMVGLGETREDLLDAFKDLANAGCQILTIGQYLQPSPESATVEKYYPPEEFDALAELAKGFGFDSVASGPFVRSSYNAAEVFEDTRVRKTTR